MVAASREHDVVIAEIVADRAAQLRTPWPLSEPRMGLPSSRREHQQDGRAHQMRKEREVPVTMAMPPAQRSLFRTDHYTSLPRRPRHSLVRLAAVMQVMPESARAAAVRATVPGSTSGSGKESGNGQDEVGGPYGGDAPWSAHDSGAVDPAADVVRKGGSPGAAQGRASANPRKRSATEENGDLRNSARDARGRAAQGQASCAGKALAEQLASRSRNPRIFPAAF